MNSRKEVRRRARHLMSLSSVFQVVVFFGWLFTAFLSTKIDSQYSFLLPPMLGEWLRDVEPDVMSVLLVTLPVWAGFFWSLVRLRGLARALYTQPSISLPVAEQFGRLARAVTLALVLMIFGPGLVGEIVLPDAYSPPGSIGLTGVLLLSIIILVLNSVSALVREACAIDDENRGFV